MARGKSRGFMKYIVMLLALILSSIAVASPSHQSEKKQRFIATLLPAIAQQNAQISANRARLLALQHQGSEHDKLDTSDQQFVAELAASYGMKNFTSSKAADWQELLARVDVIPGSLVLAQAALESGWGTSRFARLGNNYFGQWCYHKGCGIVPRGRAPGSHYEVKRFASVQQAMASYFHNLNSNRAYRKLREIRAELRAQDQPLTGEALSAGLVKYSQRGQLYVDSLRRLIHNNARLAALDHLQLESGG